MVDQKRLTEQFCKLVSFDSESYGERQMADYLKEQLRCLGLQVEEDRAWEQLEVPEAERKAGRAGNLYGYLPAYESQAEPILLSAHMDTVKPGIGKQAILHEDGRITSDGTTVLGADDAAGLAEILEVLRILKERKLPHPEIEVLFPIAEEPYAQGSRVFDYTKLKARQAYVLDLSGPVGRAAVAAPTILALQIRIRGRAAHAGFCPEEGIHTIAIAAKAIAQLPNGRTKRGTTVNFGTIRGGTGRNIVPDSCEITGEIRGLDHEDSMAQADQIRRVFMQVAEEAGGSAEVEVKEEIHAYRTSEQSAVAERFRRACAKLGLQGELVDTLGGSDNNHFSRHGIQGLVVANAMNQVHSVHEYTTVQELVLATELVLESVIDDKR